MASRIPLRGKTHAAFLGFKGGARASVFGRFGNALRYVRAGSQFSRVSGPLCSETARVLSVSANPKGIPHIRYTIIADKTERQPVGRSKVLPLPSFAENFRNAVGED